MAGPDEDARSFSLNVSYERFSLGALLLTDGERTPAPAIARALLVPKFYVIADGSRPLDLFDEETNTIRKDGTFGQPSERGARVVGAAQALRAAADVIGNLSDAELQAKLVMRD